jgi:NAD(P)-dependent dehydrogenase (short-subunit alcohol dehydrogenase family)
MTKKGKYDSPWKATLQGIKDRNKKEGEAVSLPATIDLADKTVLITGASSGLGWATAVRCAKAGARLYMVNRSGFPEKIEELKRLSGNDKISGYQVDLSDLDQVSALPGKIKADNLQIDFLISNAAMVPLKSRQTKQGLEEMFAVNYLAPFYLIRELVAQGLVKKEGRIIIVSSESHRNASDFEWDKFGKYEAYAMNQTVSRYGYYKLFLTTFARELSRRTPLPVRSLCPGPVNSNIAREAPAWMQPLLKMSFSLFFRSPEKASDPVIYFVTEAMDTKDFDYLFLMRKKEIDEKAASTQNGTTLWNASEELISSLGYPLTPWQ